MLLISDFYTPDCSRELAVLKRHHDLLAIRVTDPREHELPDIGLIELEDAETGEQILVDTSDSSLRERYEMAAQEHDAGVITMMRRLRIPFVHLKNGEDLYNPLHLLFRVRPGGEL